jgi:hypothetical protein
MLQFYELDINDQIDVLKQYTYVVSLDTLQTNGAILPHLLYDKRSRSTELSYVIRKLQTTDKLLQSVLRTISYDTFNSQFHIDTIRGIVLQKNGKTMFFCSNLIGYDSNQVAVICLDDLVNSPRIEYHYGDKMPERWKMLYVGIGFALVSFLLNSANSIRIRIE